MRPAPFGSVTGFCFDLAYVTEDGLQMKGMALAAQRRNLLDLLLFTAPAEYYFDRHAQTVERLFALDPGPAPGSGQRQGRLNDGRISKRRPPSP